VRERERERERIQPKGSEVLYALIPLVFTGIQEGLPNNWILNPKVSKKEEKSTMNPPMNPFLLARSIKIPRKKQTLFLI
jgi:hypothetical protein